MRARARPRLTRVDSRPAIGSTFHLFASRGPSRKSFTMAAQTAFVLEFVRYDACVCVAARRRFSSPHMRGSKYTLTVTLALALHGCSKPKPEVRHVPDAAAQEHIRQVIDSLPVDSSLRRTLEAGRFGNGIHEPWMD